jgi:CHAT domain-containing protein
MTQQDAEKTQKEHAISFNSGKYEYVEDKPMTRSGLLLAGCMPTLNHQTMKEGEEDGILTAAEISRLDMRGLDMVVMSACESGLGDIASGEGVFGLQRGFKNAGAKTIVMSLWKVNDMATQQLMASFYEYLLDGQPKEKAFRMAQEELKKQSTFRKKKPDWAAFIMLDGITK